MTLSQFFKNFYEIWSEGVMKLILKRVYSRMKNAGT